MRDVPVRETRSLVTAPTVPATTTPEWRPGFWGDRSVAVAGLGLAGLLSLTMVALVLGQPHGGVAAAIAAVAMTAPVAYARMAPTTAGLTLAVAAAVNEVFFGHLARCGAALPAAFVVAFVAGYALGRHGRAALAGTAACGRAAMRVRPALGVRRDRVDDPGHPGIFRGRTLRPPPRGDGHCASGLDRGTA